ncbi:MAG: DUF4349 domain-containing protein [Spirochaetales bacterium]|nr:DUF4349 domain-containing protein [Spirochaetales bacterium]
MKFRVICALPLAMLFFSCAGLQISAPPGFAAYSFDDWFEAVSPEGMRYRVRVIENKPAQTLDFWSEALSTHLTKEGYLPFGAAERFSAQGDDGLIHEWVLSYGHEDYIYMTALVVTDSVLAVIESAAEQSVYRSHRNAIVSSLEALDLTDAKPGPGPGGVSSSLQGNGMAKSALFFPEAAGAADFASGGAPAAPAAAPSVRSMAAPSPGAGSVQTGQSAPPVEPAGDRKQVYSGACDLVVDDITETKKTISLIAEDAGGYVEAIFENTVVIRVPAARFDSVFEQVLAQGEIKSKRLETYDVTEYFVDTKIRLELSERTKERLYALLEKTQNVKERLKILQEISRLTEEIERIRSALATLEQQIEFSRITANLQLRRAPVAQDKMNIPFGWIARLDPLYPTTESTVGNLTLSLGDDFAVFDDKTRFRAEAAEGTRVRLGTVRNSPEGDGTFWQHALIHHLKPFYAESSAVQAGEFRGALFVSKDRRPFLYFVAVFGSGEDEDLAVFEAFFPDEAAYERRMDSLIDALEQAEVK